MKNPFRDAGEVDVDTTEIEVAKIREREETKRQAFREKQETRRKDEYLTIRRIGIMFGTCILALIGGVTYYNVTEVKVRSRLEELKLQQPPRPVTSASVVLVCAPASSSNEK